MKTLLASQRRLNRALQSGDDLRPLGRLLAAERKRKGSLMAKSTAKNNATDASSAPVDFVVITALEEERDTLLSRMRGVGKLDKEATDIHTYYRARVRSQRRDRSEYQVIVTCLLNMGPINALPISAALCISFEALCRVISDAQL